MSEALVQRIADRFRAYAEPFLEEPGDTFAYQLKVEHSARVTELARDIASAEAVPEKVALAARIAAQVHDVGRFPQYKEFRTFRDSSSANHAGLSVRHVLRETMLSDAPKDIRRLVLGAIYLHNKRFLPERLPGDLLQTAHILRDSDKLDIYPVLIAHFAKEQPDHPEVMHDVQLHETAYSEHVVDALMRREMCDYKTIAWTNDFKLNAVGWVYDLNFRRSCVLLHENGYLDVLFDSLPSDSRLAALRRQIYSDLARRLNGDYLP